MNAATEKTRIKILLTAEKLFAERGVDRVSMRQINLSAGQKNSSAMQYHFGNKVALLEAIYDHRMEPINQRRLKMLGELEQAGLTNHLHRLVEVLILPLAEQLRSHGTGYYYIPIVVQVVGHPSYHSIAQHRSRHGECLQRLIPLIKSNLPDVPEELVLQRFGMAMRQIFNELADYQRLNLSRGGTAVRGMSLFVSSLVDAVAAQFAAPVSEATLSEIKGKPRKSA